ncbi:MAG: hypothetical protein Q8Q35_01950 [Nanoarchaeota archaeon]|nr:hypothetical protein [Nanoarchaeota archaeon]
MIIRHFPKRRLFDDIDELTKSLEDNTLRTVYNMIHVLYQEFQVRPETIDILGVVPPVLLKYLGLNEKDRKFFDRFRIKSWGYLEGDSFGDHIKSLEHAFEGSWEMGTIGRECRFTYQMIERFDDYMINNTGERFNNRYIRKTQDGKRLIWNIFNNEHREITIPKIVEYASSARPLIMGRYVGPGDLVGVPRIGK